MKRPILLALIFLLQTAITWGSTDPCESEKTSLCTGLPENRQIACLVQKREKLSSACVAELRRLNQIVKDTGARSGGGGLQSFGGMMGGPGLIPPDKTIVSFEGVSAFEGRPTVINQGKVSVTTPVWSEKGRSFVSSVNAGTLKFNERIRTPDGDRIGELHRFEISGQYTIMSPDKSMKSFRGTVGSAGDKPFSSSREYIFSANAFYVPPSDSDNKWIYVMFISNNNSFLNYVPIPGVIYLYKKEKFTGLFGLPFLSFQWTPSERWLYSVSFFVTNFRTSIGHTFETKTQLSANFLISQQTFLRENREELRDRLFFADKRLFLSLRHPFSDDVSVELQGGQSFDRSLREGKRFNETDWRRDLGRSWYSSAMVNVSF